MLKEEMVSPSSDSIAPDDVHELSAIQCDAVKSAENFLSGFSARHKASGNLEEVEKPHAIPLHVP